MKPRIDIEAAHRDGEEPVVRQLSKRREQIRRGVYHIKPCPTLDDYDAVIDTKAFPVHPRKR